MCGERGRQVSHDKAQMMAADHILFKYNIFNFNKPLCQQYR